MHFYRTRLPTSNPLVRIAWEQAVLPALATGLDMLHCPVNVLPALLPCPAVLTIHDLSFLRYPERFRRERRAYLAALTRSSAKRAKKIMTDSTNTKQDVMELFDVPSDKIEVVYPGLDRAFHPHDP